MKAASSMSDLVLAVSLKRNLDRTVRTFHAIDVPVWEQLMTSQPDKFVNLACQGYKARQHVKREISKGEMDDFVKQFVWKFYLIQLREQGIVPDHLTDLALFELSDSAINYFV